jgi:hypothetical protein
MTIELNSYMIPALICVLIWGWAIWPREYHSNGYFDYDFSGLFRGFVAIVLSLVTWLIYFAVRFYTG